MRKKVALIFAAVGIIGITGCGTGSPANENVNETSAVQETNEVSEPEEKTKQEDSVLSKYYGTWTIDSVIIEGTAFTISEVEAMGDYSMSDCVLVIKEGGKVFVSGGGGDSGFADWSASGDNLTIGIREAVLEDGKLKVDTGNDENKMIFAKTSDSQEITEEIAN